MRYLKLFLLVTLIAWCLSLVIAPCTLPPGTVILGEKGRANFVDYVSLWIKLPPYHRIVYYLGDAICHQKTSRSFIINGNQMPVCARDTGLYYGVLVAYTLLYILELKYSELYNKLSRTIFRRWRRFALLYIALSAPAAIDFILQFTGIRPSDNMTRLTTGLLFGFGNTFLFYHLLLEEPPDISK